MPGYKDRFIRAPDGLRLHLRDYGDPRGKRLPAICLPGLSRNSSDFHALAEALAADPAASRRVIALDFRGRGLSDYDPNSLNYDVPVELLDVLAVVTALELAPALFIGTSRGGLVAMAMAAKHPRAMAGVVLNDIGPVVEVQGLLRIKGYVGKLPQPASFEEGGEILRRVFSAQFPNLAASDWVAAARNAWREQNGRLVLAYDPALAKTLDSVAPEKPVPTRWPEFEALGQMPLLVIRGANSDLLSAETLAQMRARHPDLDAFEVADQGHAPLLAEPETIAVVARFATECDAVYQ
jgi:pimeloyl-ACP methyl ester carboxylesterase